METAKRETFGSQKSSSERGNCIVLGSSRTKRPNSRESLRTRTRPAFTAIARPKSAHPRADNQSINRTRNKQLAQHDSSISSLSLSTRWVQAYSAARRCSRAPSPLASAARPAAGSRSLLALGRSRANAAPCLFRLVRCSRWSSSAPAAFEGRARETGTQARRARSAVSVSQKARARQKRGGACKAALRAHEKRPT
jgi:hypothetical protein